MYNKKKKIILFLNRDFKSLGGIERYIDNFIKHHNPELFDLVAFLPSSARENIRIVEKVKYFYYYYYPFHFSNFFRFINPLLYICSLTKGIKDNIRDLNADIVFCTEVNSVIAVRLVSKNKPVYFLPGSLLIWDIKFDRDSNGGFLYKISRKIQQKIVFLLEKRAFKICNKTIVFSEAFKKRIIQCYHIDASKIKKIEAGISLTNNIVQEKRRESENNFVNILSVSRLVKSKNLDMAITSMGILRERYKWFIVGEGPYRQLLEEKIRKNKLENQVILVGQTNDLDKYYAGCDVFVHLSYYENFGQVLLEAMLYGKPPIVLRPESPGVFTASSEIICDGYNGFFVDNNAEKISEKVRELSSMDMNEITINCKEFAKQYSFENHLRKLFNLIEEDGYDA